MAGRKASNREIVLGVILGIAVIWALWFLTGGGADGLADGEGQNQDESLLSGDAPRIRMDLLAGLAEPYNPKGRDLFKYAQRPPSQAELDAAAARKVERVMKQAPKVDRPPPVVKRPPPKPTGPVPPRVTFKYIARIGPQADPMAVFEDGDELILARVGEVVLKKFKVVEIEYETVVMGYTDERFEKLTKTLNQTK